MAQVIQTLGISGIIAVVAMLLSLIGMIVCAKKQDSIAFAKPAALFLMLLVMVCAVVILMRTGVLSGQEQKKTMINTEMKYVNSSYFMLGNHIGNKMPGAKILLIVDKQMPNDTRSPVLLDCFKQGLAGKATIAIIETPSFTPSQGSDAPSSSRGPPPASEGMISSKILNDLMDKYTDCNLIVSFIGLPYDFQNMNIWAIWEEGTMPEEKRPKLAFINGVYRDLKAAIKSGIITAVITMKPNYKSSDEPAPSDLKQAFEKRYLLITPDNVDQISQTYQKMFRAE